MGNSDKWSLIGLNMTNGADAVNAEFYKRSLPKNALSNPFYAGVEVSE